MATPELPSGALRPLLLRRLLILAAAVAVGLALQRVLAARLEAIVELSHRDMLAARAELAHLFQLVGTAVFGLTGALGVAFAWSCRKPAEARQFPPPGLLSYGAHRLTTGPRAQMLTRIGFGVGVALFAASLAAGALIWYAAAVLLACRA
jgi:hypothetical protein